MLWRSGEFEPDGFFRRCSEGSHVPKFSANGPECQVVQKARFKLNEMLSVVE
jgi:hypothetical protein